MTTPKVGHRVRITNPSHGYVGMSGDVVKIKGNLLHVEVNYRGGQVVIVHERDVEEVKK